MFAQIENKISPKKLRLKKPPITTPPLSHEEFEYVFSSLIFDDPFYGLMALYIQRVQDAKCKTAYVKITKDGTIIMGYNPLWMGSLPPIKRIGVIKHEFAHLIFWHLTARRPTGKRLKLWNLAADAAANCLIDSRQLPEDCIMPGRALAEGSDPDLSAFFESLPVLQSAEYYFYELIKFQEKWKQDHPESDDDYGFLSQDGDDDLTLDDHDIWDEIDEEVNQTIKEKMRDILEEIVNQAAKTAKTWGSIPKQTQIAIQKSLNREIPWDKILESFLGRARSRQETSSIKVINRRYPYIHPGFKKKTQSRVWIFGDQSASVSDDDLAMFFGTLSSLSKIVDEFIYYPFDVKVYHENKIVWRANQQVKTERVATGGTNTDCIVDFLNANRGACDAAIILTDGYAPQMKPIYGVDVLWVITQNGTLDAARKGQRVIKMSDPKLIQRL